MVRERNTFQKAVVLKTVTSMHNHPTADQIYDQIVREYPSISRSTVYRILNQLADAGDIRRVEVSSGANRFDFCLEDHWHIHCASCDRVEDVQVTMPDVLQEAVDQMGFLLLNRYITFEGLCPECQNSNKAF